MNELYGRMLKRLVMYRERHGYNQEEMGNIFGVTQSHYSKLEQGKKIISGDTLQNLNRKNVDIDYFITGEASVKTELNEYMERCASEYRGELLQILVWLVNRGIKMMNRENEWEKVEYRKELELFHLKDWDNRAKECIWYGIRQVYHMTQAQMSDALEINIKKYRDMEKINKIPDAGILVNLYNVTGIMPSFLFAEEPNNLNTLNHTWRKFTPKVQKSLLEVLDIVLTLFHETVDEGEGLTTPPTD